MKRYVLMVSVLSVCFTFVLIFCGLQAVAANPQQATLTVYAIVKPSGASNYHHISVNFIVDYYNSSDTAGTWNGKYTSTNNKRLSNGITSGISYSSKTYSVTEGPNTYTGTLASADVDRYWDSCYVGYTKVSNASVAQNCHGYSTGVGYWLDSFQTLVDNDYTKSIDSKNLASGVIKGNDTHSIKISKVAVDLVNGEKEYSVIETIEKYRDSGVYKKTITNEKYRETDAVPYTFYKKN